MDDELEDQPAGGAPKRGKKPKIDIGQAPAGLPPHASADEPTVVRWVARNIDVREPDPRTCPDPFAWTLLRTCRSDPSFVPFFVEKLWSKLIPARSQLEGAGPKEFDGKPQLELIKRIEAMRDEAEASVPTMNPKKAPKANRLSALAEQSKAEEQSQGEDT